MGIDRTLSNKIRALRHGGSSILVAECFKLAAKLEDKIARLLAILDVMDGDEAADTLLQEMGRISEDYYCAGWLTSLEFDLWRMVQGGDTGYGFGRLSPHEVDKLRWLSEQCGGWWIWDEQMGARFVTLKEWESMYKSHEEAKWKE